MALPIQPALNIRRRLPQVCGHCRYLSYPGDGTSVCKRPNGPAWDSGDGFEWMTVCDRFTRYNSKKDQPEF
jgi:hypothetical protein